jgi:hypothetical protein
MFNCDSIELEVCFECISMIYELSDNDFKSKQKLANRMLQQFVIGGKPFLTSSHLNVFKFTAKIALK